MATRLRPHIAAAPLYCVCGHSAATHDHWRVGTDCGACGRTACPRFVLYRRPSVFARAAKWADHHEDLVAGATLTVGLIVLYVLFVMVAA